MKKACAPGYYCPEGSTSEGDCPERHYCPDAYDKVECGLGDLCESAAKRTAPLDCPAGKFCADPARVQDCLQGDYCPERTTEELSANRRCPVNYYCTTPSVMRDCPLGFSCPRGTHTLTPCAGGEVPKPGGCELCAVGRFVYTPQTTAEFRNLTDAPTPRRV